MASISTATDGNRRLIFKGTGGNRKTIHLGTVPVRWANDLRDLVESLLQHQRHDSTDTGEGVGASRGAIARVTAATRCRRFD